MTMDRAHISLLIQEVCAYKERAYVPYSGFPVCALLIDDQNRKHFGVNIENASYGLTVCAERAALAAAVTQGMKTVSALLIAAETENPVTPCGACRQVIAEFCTEHSLIICANFQGSYVLYTIDQLLPFSFTANFLYKDTPQP